MAYAPKYQATFDTIAGYTYRVSIEIDGYGGSASAFDFAGAGHTAVDWNPSSDSPDEMGPLLLSECTVRLFDPTGAILADVGPDVRLHIEQDTGSGYATYWMGYTTALSRQSADQYEYEIEVHAADGLARLQKIEYDDVFAASGRLSIAEAIHTILSEVGHGFDVAMASNWYTYRGGSQLAATDDPLLDRTFEQEVFRTDYVKARASRRRLSFARFDGVWRLYDVLVQLLTLEGLVCYQRPGGLWDVVQRELLESGSYTAWTYPAAWGASTRSTRSTDVTVSNDYLARHRGGAWDKTEAYRSASVLYEHGKLGDAALPNPKFENIDSGTGVAEDWTKVGSATTSAGSVYYFENRIPQRIEVATNTQTDPFDPAAALNDSERTLETTGTDVVSGSGPLTITFNVHAPNCHVPIEVNIGGYWIEADGTADNTGSAEDHLIIATIASDAIFQNQGWQQVTVTIDSAPTTGALYVALWQPVSVDPDAAVSATHASYGRIGIDYAEGGESDNQTTSTVASGDDAAEVDRPAETLFLGSGPIASIAGSIQDGLGGIAAGYQRGPVTGASSGLSAHQMLAGSYVSQHYAQRIRHEGTYHGGDLLTPFEIWQTPVVQSRRLGLSAFTRLLDVEDCVIRVAVVTAVSGSVTYAGITEEAPSATGGAGTGTSGSVVVGLSSEIARRAAQDPLTVTDAEISDGAQTTLSMTAYGGSYTRLFDNDGFVLVAKDTGEKHLLTVNDASHVGPAATGITFDSYAFPRPIPAGSGIFLAARVLMENALKGGADYVKAGAPTATPGTGDVVAARDVHAERALNVGTPASPSTTTGDVVAKHDITAEGDVYAKGQAAASTAEYARITSTGKIEKSGATGFAAEAHDHSGGTINPTTVNTNTVNRSVGTLAITGQGVDVNGHFYSEDGTGIGFFGASAAAQPTVSGSTGSNAALQSLLAALATLGLINDTTT